jgi:hypothetical protein
MLNDQVLHDGYFRLVKRNGREILITSDSVGVLVHLEDTDEVVLISQNREGAIREDSPAGTVTEVVAGRFDRAVMLEELIVSECKEEIGAIGIEPRQIQIINDRKFVFLSPGAVTERMVLAYVRIHSSQLEPDRVFGLEEEGEHITRYRVSIAALETMIYDDIKTFTLAQWFLRQRAEKKL